MDEFKLRESETEEVVVEEGDVTCLKQTLKE